MGLYSTPIGDGWHEVVVDYPYAAKGKRRKYYQRANQAVAYKDVKHFVAYLTGACGYEYVHVHHDPDYPRYLVTYIAWY